MYALFSASLLFTAGSAIAKSTVSDEQVKQSIIDESISSYPGNCPCPYNSARNGSSCGGRSAWSRAGGYSPICYKKEVTKERVKAWRESHRS
ncbi:hypothetical protein GRH90_19580 [Enterobacteriales bacterium SAP-6]|uniref:Uncharacterized protein n=1 Tax=Acerihabitans arboris TaxID=2691583 RepID=A0A845SP34_9GAMM|nr:hypothetical protein [Acerihabitans arboris]